MCMCMRVKACLYLLPQVEDELLLGIHLHRGLVLNVACPGRIVECVQRLLQLGAAGRAAGDHERDAGAAQGVHEELCQLGVAIGYMG